MSDVFDKAVHGILVGVYATTRDWTGLGFDLDFMQTFRSISHSQRYKIIMEVGASITCPPFLWE